MRLRLPLILLAVILAVIIPVTGALALSSKDVEKELICQCGCTMVVNVCDCGTAGEIRTKISELIDQGQNKGQIIDYFVGKYGEAMLASPSKKGFNLVAWILPFVAVAAAGAAVFFILKTWVLKGKAGSQEMEIISIPMAGDEIDEYRGRLEEELRRFKEEGTL
jgi:cytochrome c-type biogenesis protein CcmH